MSLTSVVGAPRIAASAARSKAITLGLIDPPGQTLAGKNFMLSPGQTLTFRALGNQIMNMGDLKPNKPGLELQRKVLKKASSLGGSNLSLYTIQVPADARPGQKFTLSSTPAYQSRRDPNYNFKFTVDVIRSVAV